jgi:hypothetical protein
VKVSEKGKGSSGKAGTGKAVKRPREEASSDNSSPDWDNAEWVAQFREFQQWQKRQAAAKGGNKPSNHTDPTGGNDGGSSSEDEGLRKKAKRARTQKEVQREVRCVLKTLRHVAASECASHTRHDVQGRA